MLAAAEWWRIIGTYGAHIWPAQFLFYGLGLVLVAWLIRNPGPINSWFLTLYLSVIFAWNGVAFFFTLAAGITGESYGTYLFGGMFVVISVFLAMDLFRRNMQYSFSAAGARAYLTAVLLVLVFCYPLFGIALGHPAERLLMPGAFPCPTTALGLLLLTMALPRISRVSFVVMLAWAIPFPPFVQIPRYGVYEDVIMFAVGVYSLVLLVQYWKGSSPHITG